jgi:hypothetical protein
MTAMHDESGRTDLGRRIEILLQELPARMRIRLLVVATLSTYGACT